MTSLDAGAQLQANLAQVRQTVAQACQRAGRDPRTVTLVAVTKYMTPPAIRLLLAAGVSEIGESRAQQLVARTSELGASQDGWLDPAQTPAPPASATAAPHWHMVGHLQRNKVKLVLPHARILHSLDSERLAAEIDAVAAPLDLVVDAFLETNVSGETSKYGVAPADLEPLIAAIRRYSRIRLRGLMTMPPFDPDPQQTRPCFAMLRGLLEQLRARGAVGPECVHLSMGMSHDYAVAIEEGASFVRVGSALCTDLPADLLLSPG